jgi:hypothetical protein
MAESTKELPRRRRNCRSKAIAGDQSGFADRITFCLGFSSKVDFFPGRKINSSGTSIQGQMRALHWHMRLSYRRKRAMLQRSSGVSIVR